jgi:phosphatidylglycerophosphate synthase
MRSVLFGIDPKWNSLLPLVAINVLMLLTVVIFAFKYKRREKSADLAGRVTSKWVGPFFYEYWGWFIAPLENLFIKLGFTPNFFTTLGVLISAGAACAFATGHFGIAGWLVIIGGTCDMFDGRIARRTGQTSQSGAFYDSVMDRFGEAIVFLGLAVFFRNTWVLYMVIAALVGSMIVSYTRAKGDSLGIDCKVGPMQRPERIVYLGVGSIFSPPLRQIIQAPGAEPVEYLAIAAISLIAVVTVLTAIYRMFYIFRKLQIREGKPVKQAKSPVMKKLTHRYLDI